MNSCFQEGKLEVSSLSLLLLGGQRREGMLQVTQHVNPGVWVPWKTPQDSHPTL